MQLSVACSTRQRVFPHRPDLGAKSSLLCLAAGTGDLSELRIGTGDVATAHKVLSNRYAWNNSCSFAIRGWGHSTFAGAASIEIGVTIDIRSLKQVCLSQDSTVTRLVLDFCGETRIQNWTSLACQSLGPVYQNLG